MATTRLVAALTLSLLGHAALLALGAGGTPGAAAADANPLSATLLASGVSEAPPAARRETKARAAMAMQEEARPIEHSARREPTALVAAAPIDPTPPENAPQTEPGSVMSMPHAGRIRYALYRGGHLIGHLQDEWHHDGNTYAIERRSDLLAATGQALAQSSGVVASDGLVPLDYRDGASGEVLHFDWQALRARITANGAGAREYGLKARAQDDLSLPYEIGQALLHGEPLSAAIASGGGVRERNFETVGEERISVGGRLLRVLHLRSAAPADTGQEELELWLGIDEQYLPLRIRRGGGADQELDQVAERFSTSG